MNEPKMRYSIELYVDNSLKWVARIEQRLENGDIMTSYTRIVETPEMALALAKNVIKESNRK